MITIIYDEKEKNMILQASGHAGYAEKGSDIVCAAVSALMQTLAYSVDGGTVTRSQDDCNTLTVQAEQSFDNMAKFELVTDGLMLLAKQYPENVRFVNLHANDTDNVDLQLFADGAASGGEGGAEGEAAPAVQAPHCDRHRSAWQGAADRAARRRQTRKARDPVKKPSHRFRPPTATRRGAPPKRKPGIKEAQTKDRAKGKSRTRARKRKS